MYPGDFGYAEEDCNCRCLALTRARKALDAEELKVMQERAEFFGLDKTENFKEFERKYLKAADEESKVASNPAQQTSGKAAQKPKNGTSNVLKPVENSGKSGIINVDKVVSGHDSTPKKAEPYTVIDHVNNAGNVNVRSFYGEDGMKIMDIHTADHGNPKQHLYGEHGEHAHDYEWDKDGKLKKKTVRELTTEERERNGDIL